METTLAQDFRSINLRKQTHNTQEYDLFFKPYLQVRKSSTLSEPKSAPKTKFWAIIVKEPHQDGRWAPVPTLRGTCPYHEAGGK